MRSKRRTSECHRCCCEYRCCCECRAPELEVDLILRTDWGLSSVGSERKRAKLHYEEGTWELLSPVTWDVGVRDVRPTKVIAVEVRKADAWNTLALAKLRPESYVTEGTYTLNSLTIGDDFLYSEV